MPRQKTNKVKLTLSVDKNLVEAAKNIGLNLSAFLEIQLRQYLSVLKNGYLPNPQVGPPRFELGSPAPKAERITRLPYGPSVMIKGSGF
ncbi:MAG: hypothetical protein XD40_0836 [Archaeoglobus fulgidus]|uniref:Uncharacterized protein n=1 Tax=Archaeoglobus fulgidus TaxID=2234 RepID=A0A124FBZ6_ARCFL|nr:MAG: hypothetical protein XD40_0836 [Archaeoglobus fulgidus]KUK07045.1 MAG: hypothetical protein XD48_0757 [Archaeoglobus fulgidus]